MARAAWFVVGLRRVARDGLGPLRLELAAIREASHGRSHPGPFPGAHLAVEDLLAGQHVVVGVQAALEGYRPATA
jgi:hypothetical protein